MSIADILTNPGLWGAIGQVGQSIGARDPSSFGYQMGAYSQKLAQAESYRKQLEAQKKAEEEKKKAGIGKSIGSVLGTVGGFVAGGPVGAAAGAELGSYAGERLGGADPNDASAGLALARAGLSAGLTKGSEYLSGKFADTLDSPQVAGASPKVDSTGAPIPDGSFGHPEWVAPTEGSTNPVTGSVTSEPVVPSGPVPTLYDLALKKSSRLKSRLADALAYTLVSPQMMGMASNALGGGSSSVPPLTSGSFGMDPELTAQINQMNLERWKAGQQVEQGGRELELSERRVGLETQRVRNEGVRARASLLNAAREQGFNFSKTVNTEDDNGNPITILVDPRRPEVPGITFKARQDKGSAGVIETIVPDGVYSVTDDQGNVIYPKSGTGFWKVSQDRRTKEQTAVPTLPPSYMMPKAERPPQPRLKTMVVEEGGKRYSVTKDLTTNDELDRTELGSINENRPKFYHDELGDTHIWDEASQSYKAKGTPEPGPLRDKLNSMVKPYKDVEPVLFTIERIKKFVDDWAKGWSKEEKRKFVNDVSEYIEPTFDPKVTESRESAWKKVPLIGGVIGSITGTHEVPMPIPPGDLLYGKEGKDVFGEEKKAYNTKTESEIPRERWNPVTKRME